MASVVQISATNDVDGSGLTGQGNEQIFCKYHGVGHVELLLPKVEFSNSGFLDLKEPDSC